MADKKYDELISLVKKELDKLKDVEDEKVKEVVSNLNTYLVETKQAEKVDEKVEEESKEEAEETKEEAVEEKETEETEEKVEEKEEKVEEKEEEKPEEKPEEPAKKEELGKKITEKLNEAAILLDKQEKEIEAKAEIINGYKSTITELEAKLKVYTDAEELELQKEYDLTINHLIQLYKGIGINKSFDDIKNNFTNDQVKNLIFDLSSAVPKAEVKSKRVTTVTAGLELQSSKPKQMSAKESAEILFFD